MKLKEERRRHRINDVRVSKGGETIVIFTNGGTATIPVHDKGWLARKVHLHLPHLRILLSKENPNDIRALHQFLVGRYAYGRSTVMTNRRQRTTYKSLL